MQFCLRFSHFYLHFLFLHSKSIISLIAYTTKHIKRLLFPSNFGFVARTLVKMYEFASFCLHEARKKFRSLEMFKEIDLKCSGE